MCLYGEADYQQSLSDFSGTQISANTQQIEHISHVINEKQLQVLTFLIYLPSTTMSALLF